MKLHEKIAIAICQKLPDCLLPKSFRDYCMTVAENELAQVKREIFRKNWERSYLEGKLSNLKNKK